MEHGLYWCVSSFLCFIMSDCMVYNNVLCMQYIVEAEKFSLGRILFALVLPRIMWLL